MTNLGIATVIIALPTMSVAGVRIDTGFATGSSLSRTGKQALPLKTDRRPTFRGHAGITAVSTMFQRALQIKAPLLANVFAGKAADIALFDIAHSDIAFFGQLLQIRKEPRTSDAPNRQN